MPRITARRARLITLAGFATLSLGLGGCAIAGFGGAMVESYKRNSTRTVKAEFATLGEKPFAVVVSADRMIEADHPDIVLRLAVGINDRLTKHVTAPGAPPEKVLQFQYNNPRWAALMPAELAAELGVKRLVFVELYEYRLNDPGNQYLWEGVAAGEVMVIDAEGDMEQTVFQTSVNVDFPDQSGFGPADLAGTVVTSELSRRFIDRATWPFYDHEEPYYPEY